MKRILAALAFASAFFVMPAFADSYTNWGVEYWECNAGVFELRLGNGAPVRVTGIRGTVAISAIPGADVAGSNSRQTLVVLTTPAIVSSPPGYATVVRFPTGNTTHQQSDNWAAWNLKQMGNTTQVTAFDYDFTRLNYVANDGRVRLVIMNATSAPGVGLITTPVECPDTEIQFEIMWAPNS